MKKLLTIVLVCFSFLLVAEVNQVLDVIYQQEESPLMESAWLILSGAGLLDDSSSLEDAQNYISQQSWGDSISGEVLTRGQLALMLTECYSLPKGLMYRITGSPHYALKDMVHLRVMDAEKPITSAVTGFELVNSLSIIVEEVSP